ncbi:MAG TPA: MBL fold metallo-hydrolase [Prolixibacteraceae bacterium]|nr:MBL fold metallo-hydrolase [Prolixibacteraceae bacterium]
MNTERLSIRFTHIRHATSLIDMDGTKFLIDPMLSGKEKLPAVTLTRNRLKNPRIDLSFTADSLLEETDYLMLTHLHFDHFDDEAARRIPKTLPVICSRNDSKRLSKMGFTTLLPVSDSVVIKDVEIKRYPAVHGHGLLRFLTGEGSSFLIKYRGIKIFLTGDCVLTDSLKQILLETEPDVLIANGGAARFLFGKPITLSIKNIKELSSLLKDTKILVVHLNALNHCTETIDFCKEQIIGFSNIQIPSNGETILLK